MRLSPPTPAGGAVSHRAFQPSVVQLPLFVVICFPFSAPPVLPVLLVIVVGRPSLLSVKGGAAVNRHLLPRFSSLGAKLTPPIGEYLLKMKCTCSCCSKDPEHSAKWTKHHSIRVGTGLPLWKPNGKDRTACLTCEKLLAQGCRPLSSAE